METLVGNRDLFCGCRIHFFRRRGREWRDTVYVGDNFATRYINLNVFFCFWLNRSFCSCSARQQKSFSFVSFKIISFYWIATSMILVISYKSIMLAHLTKNSYERPINNEKVRGCLLYHFTLRLTCQVSILFRICSIGEKNCTCRRTLFWLIFMPILLISTNKYLRNKSWAILTSTTLGEWTKEG